MEDPIVAGALQSTKRTETQNKLIEFMGYFAKLAKTIDVSYAVIRVEKPEGLMEFLREKEIRYKDKAIGDIPYD